MGRSSLPSPAGVHLLAAITGKGGVRVKHAGWKSRFLPARVGMFLRNGDLLELAPKTTVRLVCADRRVKVLSAGAGKVFSGVPCPSAARSAIVLEGDRWSPPRGGDIPPLEYPVLVSPRLGSLLGPRFPIRWLPAKNASRYSVMLQGPGLRKILYEGPATEIAYPVEAPRLTPGESYAIIVWAGNRHSDEEDVPERGFTPLAEPQRRAVIAAEREIRRLRLAPSQTPLLVAALYAAQNLYAESVVLLETLSKTAKEPAALQLLGNLYLRQGLGYLAEQPYRRALRLAQAAGDGEAEARAYTGLARAYRSLIRDAESREQWRRALAIYRNAGHAEKIRWIEKEIAALPPQ